MTNQEQEPQFGKYTIQDELGRGGFATVYKAHDSGLRRDVALKLLHPSLLTDPAFVTRFENDARATAQLDHPRIATIYELGHHDGRLYMAVQLLSGGSLAERIKTHGRLAFSEAVRVVEDIAQALDYAHAAGFIHRDVKPSNILFNRRGDAILTDFGLVKAAESSVIARTTMGGLIGTPAYMAPEIWEGQSEGPGADIYALGCVLFEMLSGELLFTGATPPAVMLAHFQPHRYPDHWPDDTPAAIETVLERALARDPAARYASAGALAADLRALAARTADPLVEPYAALEAALAAQEWDRASILAQEISARDASYRNIRALADQAAVGQRQAALAGQVAPWRDTALAAERSGQLDAARAAARQWLDLAPADAEARALVQRLGAAEQVAQERANTGNGQTTSQSEEPTQSDQEAARPAPDQETAITPNFRLFIALTTIGMALGLLVAGSLVQNQSFATPLSSAIGGTVAGLIIALALQQVLSPGSRGYILIVAGWTVAAAITSWLVETHNNQWYLAAIAGGVIVGLTTTLALRGTKVSLRWYQFLLISAGWAVGLIAGVFAIIIVASQIANDANRFALALSALHGAVAGAIGGTVMAWQIGRARRQASAVPSSEL